MSILIRDKFESWEREAADRFNTLKANEEELNRIFIEIYGLQDELTPEVEDKDVTVRKADLGREIRSLISYAVGCMFGRYSLDVEGLVYAGGEFCTKSEELRVKSEVPFVQIGNQCFHKNAIEKLLEQSPTTQLSTLQTQHLFGVDPDNILPITDDEYFEDDILGKFVDFIRKVYGSETCEANLKFIADALGSRGNSPREVIRNYFLTGFYKDHVKIYQKRPIYWLFDSGKENAFKALIYMHRYQPDLLAKMRTDYVHEQQERYRTQLQHLEQEAQRAGAAERVKINNQIIKLQNQARELIAYEEKIHHLADQMIAIDLDDGVKVNYAKFGDVLAGI